MALCFGERLYGEGWWVKNMVACGGWCSIRTGWGNFFTALVLRWVWALWSNSSMIHVVVIEIWRIFQNYFIL